MSKKYKFSWDSFHSLSHIEKSYALHNYVLTTGAISKNLFALVNFYIVFYGTKNLLNVYKEFNYSSKSLLEYNFKSLISYCKLYNFYGMR